MTVVAPASPSQSEVEGGSVGVICLYLPDHDSGSGFHEG